jgi:hypothetical protein
MTHHIDINGVQSIEVEAVFPNVLAAHPGKRYGRRILVRTQFGMTTINLHAETESELAMPGAHPPPPASAGPRSRPPQGLHNKR